MDKKTLVKQFTNLIRNSVLFDYPVRELISVYVIKCGSRWALLTEHQNGSSCVHWERFSSKKSAAMFAEDYVCTK